MSNSENFNISDHLKTIVNGKVTVGLTMNKDQPGSSNDQTPIQTSNSADGNNILSRLPHLTIPQPNNQNNNSETVAKLLQVLNNNQRQNQNQNQNTTSSSNMAIFQQIYADQLNSNLDKRLLKPYV